MSFEKPGDIVREAYKNKYGVVAFNAFNYEAMKFVIEAADQVGKPVLIQHYPGWYDYISFETAVEMAKSLAKKAKVPVGLHLDHCYDIDLLKHAMRAGFMSVMCDGSKMPFDDNIKFTKETVKAAKEFGADVEAELGNIGSAANISDYADKSKFTDPDDALRFLNETGIFSLAVAVGNAHGNYAVLPNLDLPRIKTISESLKIPLVLHGGSGIPDEQLKEAVKCGIAKVNVCTDYFRAFYDAVKIYVNDDKKSKDIFACMIASQKDVTKFLVDKINVLNG
ncbi:MAG: class II fructose-bisphosphate aldolase [Oscillospiraceae bacterium]|nr:class II fructose-bisphosphate aldolase [Oscillospiraceae bacterium]